MARAMVLATVPLVVAVLPFSAPAAPMRLGALRYELNEETAGLSPFWPDRLASWFGMGGGGSVVHTIAFVLLVLLPPQTLADDPVSEDQLQAYLESAETKTDKNRSEVQKLHSLAKKGRISQKFKKPSNLRELGRGRRRYEFRTREDKDRTMASLEKRLETVVMPKLKFGEKMKVGHVGTVPVNVDAGGGAHLYRVLQVIDGNRVLVECRYLNRGRRVPGDPSGRLYGKQDWSKVFLARVPTAGLVDDSEMVLSEVYKVVGTERFQATGGATSTVFVLEPFDVTPFLPKPEEYVFRTWTDTTGKFKTEAQFVSLRDGEVTLEKLDGKTVHLSLKKLSKIDQEFIRKQK